MAESQTNQIFERFLIPSERTKATAELASQKEAALLVLTSLFDGSAKNQHGIPYRELGTPLDCGLVAAGRLGPIAKPLEHS